MNEDTTTKIPTELKADPTDAAVSALPVLDGGAAMMTKQEAAQRGYVTMTTDEYERYEAMEPGEKRKYLFAKTIEMRVRAKRDAEANAPRIIHPLGQLTADERRQERNRRKAARR